MERSSYHANSQLLAFQEKATRTLVLRRRRMAADTLPIGKALSFSPYISWRTRKLEEAWMEEKTEQGDRQTAPEDRVAKEEMAR